MAESGAAASRLDVVVFSCGGLGVEVANRLAALDCVGDISLFRAPWRSRGPTTPLGRLREALRMEGLGAVTRRVLGRILGRVPSTVPPPPEPAPAVGVAVHAVDDLHAADTLERVRALAPDLGVVAGTYVLRESLFALPRLGSINLHSGKAPEYRGSEPAFWELYNGEREVGITIHRVARKLDAGDILLQETFPLDPGPADDPFAYLDRYRDEVLRPNGVRMLCEAVARIAAGRAEAVCQDPARARTWRRPDARTKRELRRRVETRRRAGTTS